MKRLIQKAQRGNDQAFLKIFQHYEADLYRMAYVYVKNPDDALDVVQEVAYQAFKMIRTLREPQFLKTWLMKITINCALDVMKKRQNVIHLNADVEEAFGSEQADLAMTMTLADMMESLHEDERSVVVLKYYQDYTFQQISDLLEWPIGTVKTTLYRAVDKLRREWKEADCYGS
ncbi:MULTISPECIES: sigma-70 family RNA polymerase sigma factor [unclassified Exiguobacterium]|uniref:sigma-70 family RNA polymerase sigma factor n=1 Tax=unclassified Exiguobacterium TaxID=2644629 RepID=UPI001BE79E26|nr:MULTISPECIES: sigma-70 family RNA polymerase sigma factor [unclassified Exiguobacterium]